MTERVYLRPDVYFEPLFNKWFMWPHLLAPASAAMNVANHHLRLMKSFVANAKIHAKAARATGLAGSSFVNLPLEKVGEVKALIDSTLQHHGDLLEFSAAVKTLNELLRHEAKGMSLEPLYAKIPAALRGLVELHYDLNNQPSFRFIEGLLYQSRFYKPQAQAVCLGTLRSAERPFVLSTPRLPDDSHLHINVPFNHPFVEALFAMRDQPQPLSYIKGLLRGLEVAGGVEIDSLFTSQAPHRPPAFRGDGIRVRYLGHAGLMLEIGATTLMIDPVIAYKNDDDPNKTTFDDVPAQVDYVMVTHAHMDHTCLETLIQLKHKIGAVLVPKSNSGNLADPSLKLMLKALGFRKVVEMDDLESLEFAEGRLLALPFLGEHADVNVRSKTAWLIDARGRRILAAADSSNVDQELYRKLQRITGDVDILFIGMECTGGPLRWLYGPLLTEALPREQDESRRFNGSDYQAASHIARTFNAAQVYVYAMGTEPWFGYFMGLSYDADNVQLRESRRLIEECRSRGLASERLNGLATLTLPAREQACGKYMF